MNTTSDELCRSVSVDIDADATFGFPAPRDTIIESPAEVRRGVYDVDLIGAFTYLGGRDTVIRHVGTIGRFCSIAANVVMGQVEHPTDFLSAHPLFQGSFDWRLLARFRADNAAMIERSIAVWDERQAGRPGKITVGHDVWIGEGAFVRRGVNIGNGAIVAARAVVTRDVPPYAIVGGSPAKVIRFRFDDAVVEALNGLQWWHYGLSALDGADFTRIGDAIGAIERNIVSGRAQAYRAPYVRLGKAGDASLWSYDAAGDRLERVG